MHGSQAQHTLKTSQTNLLGQQKLAFKAASHAAVRLEHTFLQMGLRRTSIKPSAMSYSLNVRRVLGILQAAHGVHVRLYSKKTEPASCIHTCCFHCKDDWLSSCQIASLLCHAMQPVLL